MCVNTVNTALPVWIAGLPAAISPLLTASCPGSSSPQGRSTLLKPKQKPRRGDPKPGPDGTIIQTRRIKTGTEAVATLKVRCRTGTFEWRYGSKGNAQHHAGTTFSKLWERAGIAHCGGGIPDLASSGSSGSAAGMSDSRVTALDRIREISREIGGPMTRRIVAYVVEGRTPKEIAATYYQQVTDRQVSDTLDLDLIELARSMGFAA
jgi:hypothetical protein